MEGEENWNKVDAMLGIVDQVMLNQAAKLNIPVGRRNHTLWRQDQPEAMIRWKGDDNIERNVLGYVNTDTLQVSIECNAWMDNKTRKWKNENILQAGQMGRASIKNAVELAFVTALMWKERDLTELSDVNLDPDPDVNNSSQDQAMRDRESEAKLDALLDRLTLRD